MNGDRAVEVRVHRLPEGRDLAAAERATAHAAGFDLRARLDEPLIVEPGSRALVPTGIVLELPEGHEGQVRPRSGLAARFQVGVLNSPGTIDSDYRGEIHVLVYNFGEEPFTIERGDRVAQLVFARVHHPHLEVRDLSSTERAAGGFGSTGKR